MDDKNFSCLNEDKTEVLILVSEYYFPKLSIPAVAIGNEQIVAAKNTSSIGFDFDLTMNLRKQIGETCKAAWLHLRNTGKISKYLDKECIEKLVHAFITSKIDVNNSLFLWSARFSSKEITVGTKFCRSSGDQITNSQPYSSWAALAPCATSHSL